MSAYHTLLVVDDNPAMLTALKICFQGIFNQVVTLSDPEQIITTLNQHAVDVVMLDMNFSPGFNTGQEGLFWLRAIHKLHADIPVVLVTAYADVRLAVKGLKAGAADFVVKPWDNDELVRTVKDAVDKSKAQHVRKVVEKCHGNMSRAAELLGITRQTLYSKLKK